jgi:ribosomal protein S18 acetylase RimI-like enzyme
VATQATNQSAQRLYQAIGFRTADSSVWFHRWSPKIEKKP